MLFHRVMATNDVGFVLNNGHGIPQMHVAHPGLTIYYWAGPAELLDTQWGQLQATIDNGKYFFFCGEAKYVISSDTKGSI